MNDLSKIEIAKIKDLDSLYFYVIPQLDNKQDEKKYLALKIAYDGNKKKLNYDYTDENFWTFVFKVINTYHAEKEKHRIILFNKLTEYIIENINVNYDYKEEQLFSQKDTISYFNSRVFDVHTIEEYIKAFIKSLFAIYYQDQKFQLGNIKGYIGRYSMEYKVGNKTKIIPLTIIKRDNGKYAVTTSIDNKQIKGNIAIKNGSVIIEWSDKNETVIGSIVYNPIKNINERNIMIDGQTVDYEQYNNPISEEEKSLIDEYLKICGLGVIDNGIATVANNYILYNIKEVEQIEKDTIFESKNAHVMISKDKIHIHYFHQSGLSKSSDSLIVPLDEEKQEIIIKLYTLDDKKYLLIQKQYHYMDKSNCEYKNKYANNYFYQIVEVTNDSDLTKHIEVLESQTVNEEIKNIDDIQKIIRLKKDV